MEYLEQWILVRQGIEQQKLVWRHVDIGKVGAWGVPLDSSKKECFPSYSSDIFMQYNDFDIIFVDGRFRVACILASILHCRPDTMILVHDFNNRAHYHKVLHFVDIVDTCDTLAQLRVKQNFCTKQAREMYKQYQYEYE